MIAKPERLDIANLHFSRFHFWRRINNLAQINRTLGNHLTPKEKLTFLQAYVGDGIFARRKKRHLVRSILKETSRQMTREKLRHRPAENQPFFEITSPAH